METSEKIKGREITLSTLCGIFKKFLWLVVISTVLFAGLAITYSTLFIKTRYTAKAEFVVVNVLDENPYISDSMLGAATQITETCVEIVNKNVLLSEAVKKHDLDKVFNCSKRDAVEKISKMISAEPTSEESSVFSVKATSSDPEITLSVISAVQDVMPLVVEELYKLSESSSITTTIKPVTVVEDIGDVSAITPSVTRYAVVGALFGFILMYAICFIVEFLDTKVYSEKTVKSNFSEPVIGSIPMWGEDESVKLPKLKRKVFFSEKRDYTGKLLTKETPFAVTEAFSALRTNILYSVADQNCPVFAVTSDFPGAGKSVVASNVAVSLATLGKKTLLIECDLRRPELSVLFEKKAQYGLSDYLAGSVKDASLIISDVGYENLSIVFSGKIPPNPAELIGSETMSQFIAENKEKYDVIIIDTPPSEVSDIAIVSSFVTGIIIVARSRYSDINGIKKTHDLIKGVKGKIVGYVLNDVDYKSFGYYKKSRRRYGKYYKDYYEHNS